MLAKRLKIIVLFFLSSYYITAQTLTVDSFKLLETDMTANTRGTTEIDQNGEVAALIKVVTTEMDFRFDIGMLGIVKYIQKAGEIWVYVPHSTQKISISHQKYGVLRDYYFSIQIDKGRTYELRLNTGRPRTQYDTSKSQELAIKVTPPTATLILNGMKVELDAKGEAIREMAHGQFDYLVQAEGFFSEDGQFAVDEDHKTLIIDNLKPITGKLSVSITPLSATVFVDGKSVGNISVEPVELQIGRHEVEVTAKGYISKTKMVTITEDQITTESINLSLVPTLVIFRVQPTSAVIFIDEDDTPHTLDSDGLCSVQLNKGQHTYRVNAASYMPESGTIEVESDKITKQVNLKSALATLKVSSTPDAEIWINEIKKGIGKWTGSVEAGTYIVEARKSSHTTVKQKITLSQQEQRTVTLSAPEPLYGSLKITGTPIGADVYIDDNFMGQIPLLIDKLLIGNHILKVKKSGYTTEAEEDVYISEGETNEQTITLKKGEYHQSHEFVDLGLSVKWATCNVGAEKPEEYGDYYAWGETWTKSSYTLEKYNFYVSGKIDNVVFGGDHVHFFKYNTNNYYGTVDYKTTLDPEDDVAHVKWGGSWRMPTNDELKELRRKCSWTWIEEGNSEFGGVAGYKVTSNKKGYRDRFIFLPAAGFRYDTGLKKVGAEGYYMSSTLYKGLSYYAWSVVFNSSHVSVYYGYRHDGLPVRPVCP